MKIDRGIETQKFFEVLDRLREGQTVRLDDRKLTVSNITEYSADQLPKSAFTEFGREPLRSKSITFRGYGTAYLLSITYEDSIHGRRWKNEARLTWPSGEDTVWVLET